jgi:hypothetical protein
MVLSACDLRPQLGHRVVALPETKLENITRGNLIGVTDKCPVALSACVAVPVPGFHGRTILSVMASPLNMTALISAGLHHGGISRRSCRAVGVLSFAGVICQCGTGAECERENKGCCQSEFASHVS